MYRVTTKTLAYNFKFPENTDGRYHAKVLSCGLPSASVLKEGWRYQEHQRGRGPYTTIYQVIDQLTG